MALINGRMEGKICLITGATSGIGMVTAVELARIGGIVVITARNSQKAKTAVEKIVADSSSPHVEGLVADLSSQAQVRALGGEFIQRYERCDVLVNNAGAVFLRRAISSDGVEMTFALNHLSPFLLTNLLLDTIKRSAPARVVNVASRSHEDAEIDFNDLEGEQGYNFMRAYGQSKLGNIMFTYELARRVEGSGVAVNAVHPGFVATNMGANNGWFVKLFLPLTRIWTISPQEGAKTVIYLASSPEVEGVTGRYFYKNRAVPSSPASQDEHSARRLWAVSAKMVGL